MTVVVLVIGAVEVVGRRGVTTMLVETVEAKDTTDITAYYWPHNFIMYVVYPIVLIKTKMLCHGINKISSNFYPGHL